MKNEFMGIDLNDDDLFVEGFQEKYGIDILNTKDSLVYSYMSASYDKPETALMEFERLIKKYVKENNFPHSISIVKKKVRMLKNPISFS